MNLHSSIWSFIVVLLSFSIKRCPLLYADSQLLNSHGYLTAEPASHFLLGSNVTVYCHFTKCDQRYKMFLEATGVTVSPPDRFNCTLTIFHLINVQKPRFTLYCKAQKFEMQPEIVGGMVLQGGLPPDKPKNITCETSRSSKFIDCSWDRGQETHVSTASNISVTRENGTQVLLDQIQDAEHITMPRAMIDENTEYQLIITAYNPFGASQSDPTILSVKDILIPETPHIIQIKFGNNSIAAVLQWKTNESSEHLRSYVRLRTDHGSWETWDGTELSEGLIQVDGLKPLTEYEFQMRTCNSTSGRTHADMPRSITSKRTFCSKWSPAVRGRSHGKGPSHQLHVWRMFGSRGKNRSQMVTVLWEPPSPEDYSGALQQYKILFDHDQKQEVTCAPALSHCSVWVPAEVRKLSISAVTLYGASPPADVPLRPSGDSGPVLRELAPAASGSALSVSWSTPGGELLHYVLEWTSVPAAELQWQKLDKDQNSTSITGLTAGVRYNISLYGVTTRGVSVPSSCLVYSKEQKPCSGPNMSVVVHEARWIQIQWDELPVSQQRGFITNYTIYLQMLDSSKTELSVMVSASEPRQKRLACPEGALALQLTASTSAGEGPRGRWISSRPATPAVAPVILMVSIFALFIAIVANLMYWSSVRRRIKQKCLSWGPAWLEQKLPKPDNSFAIKILEQGVGELPLSSTYSDPPLSPISLISQEERDSIYPNIHVEIRPDTSGQPTAETPLLMSDPETMLVDSQLEHVSYKPQIAMLGPEEEEMMEREEQMDGAKSVEEDRCSSVCEGILGGFLSSVQVELSDSPLELTFSSFSCPLYHKSSLNGGFLSKMMGSEDDKEEDPPSLDLQQDEIMTHDTTDTCLSQCTVEIGGYLAQVAAVSSTTLSDTQR